jgi:hypothetical protein
MDQLISDVETALFVPERFDRIEASSLVGRVQSEKQAHDE